MVRYLAGVALLSAFACASGDTGETFIDADGDGVYPGRDCDDANPNVFTGADEICDGVDNDCDGVVDPLDSIGAVSLYKDGDGDGYGIEMFEIMGCPGEPGYADKPGDCDDTDPDVYPGAPEDCTIDKDFNCDGASALEDSDADTHPGCMDCDDQDETVHPGATEVCDGKDNDCNGQVDDGPLEDLCGMVANTMMICAGEEGCAVGDCDPEWYDTNALSDDGCECQSDPLPEMDGSTCATAIDLGSFPDTAPATVPLAGNSAAAGREVWYTFQATDDLDTAGDEFHVDVRFTTNPSAGYALAVYRNGCPGTGEELATAETSTFDWFTDQTFTPNGCTMTAPCGEGNCGTVLGESDKNLCSVNSATFYFKIYRPDAAASCYAYAVDVSNAVY
jgi:hypothetical protein